MAKYMSNRCRKGDHKHCSRFVAGNPPRPCKCKCHTNEQ